MGPGGKCREGSLAGTQGTVSLPYSLLFSLLLFFFACLVYLGWKPLGAGAVLQWAHTAPGMKGTLISLRASRHYCNRNSK